MKTIETDFIHISFLDEEVVLVEAKHGVEIDAAKASYGNQLITDEMPGDYGMIIDRKEDYSIVPVEVYKILNSLPHLKAIAIVRHRPATTVSIDMEQRLFKGPLEVFDSVENARKWINGVIH